jgi:hypothetical protein
LINLCVRDRAQKRAQKRDREPRRGEEEERKSPEERKWEDMGGRFSPLPFTSSFPLM